MNKDGVQGFNKGGVVGFNNGGKATGGAGLDIGALTGALFSLQFAFQDVANIFSGEGTTLGGVLQTLITVGTSLAFTLQAINAQQLAQGFGNLVGGIKKLPTNLKAINKSVTNFGKTLQSSGGFSKVGGPNIGAFGGRARQGSAAFKTDKLLSRGASKLGNVLNKLPKGQLISKVGANAIGKLLASSLTGPVAAAIGAAIAAEQIGRFIGGAVADSLLGAQEEIAGVRGVEGATAGDAAIQGALRNPLNLLLRQDMCIRP